MGPLNWGRGQTGGDQLASLNNVMGQGAKIMLKAQLFVSFGGVF
jgi:hypothetical protein